MCIRDRSRYWTLLYRFYNPGAKMKAVVSVTLDLGSTWALPYLATNQTGHFCDSEPEVKVDV